MTSVDLIAYISRAIELEGAAYTQKKMQHNHAGILDEKARACPPKPKLDKPLAPQEPILEAEPVSSLIKFLILPVVGIAAIAYAVFSDSLLISILGLIIALGGIFLLSKAIRKRTDVKKRYKKEMEEYRRQCELYPAQLEKYEQDFAEAQKEYQMAVDIFFFELHAYDKKKFQPMYKRHIATTNSLNDALDSLYALDIIDPKYRNLVALSSIKDYLLSGRCSNLEGNDGAYELYESQLSQKSIVSKLHAVAGDLSNISSGQPTLYQELSKANATVDRVINELRETNENTGLIAYFEDVAAIIDAHPNFCAEDNT